MSESAAQTHGPFDKPPVYDGKTNMEYAAPGTADWAKEASARLIRLREDYETLREWASEQEGNAFAEQVMWDAEARLSEWDTPVRRWEPMKSAATASAQHPHEPEIPPALNAEGRCLICRLLVQLDEARDEVERRAAENARLQDGVIQMVNALWSIYEQAQSVARKPSPA